MRESRQFGCWVEVRQHAPTVLPLEWGIWKRRYCITEPAKALVVRFFKEEPVRVQVAEPEAIVLCDTIDFHSKPCFADLCLGGKPITWLKFAHEGSREAFAANLRSPGSGTAQPIVQPPAALSRSASCPREVRTPSSHHSHATMQQSRQLLGGVVEVGAALPRQASKNHPSRDLSFLAMRQQQQNLEVKEVELSQKEWELAIWEADLREKEESMGSGSSRNSLLRSESHASVSDDELCLPEKPIGFRAVMDWPLSRAEKQLRLVNVMDKLRIASDEQCRRSAPAAHLRKRSSEPVRVGSRVGLIGGA